MEDEEEHKGEKEKKEEKEGLRENTEKIEKKEEREEVRKNIDKKANLTSSDKKGKLTEKMRENPWVLSTLVLGVITLILLIANFSGGMTGGVISEGYAEDAIMDFVKSQGADAEFVSVEEDGNFYKVTILFQNQEMPLYVTKDGEFLVQGLTPLNLPPQTAPQQQQQQTDIPKSDVPIVELFVMSFCPYGNRGENTLLPVYELLGDKVDWNVNYIVSVNGDAVSSLHGQPEVDQNIREVCVKRDYGLDTFWKFINYVNQNCGRDGSCWEDAAKEAGADSTQIQSCFDKDGLDLMKAEADASNEAGASGSPTLLINGVKSDIVYQYENSEAYKQVICDAFNDAPEECEETLGATSSSTSAGGSC